MPLLVWLLCLWSWGTCGFPLSVLRWLPCSGSAPAFLRLDGLASGACSLCRFPSCRLPWGFPVTESLSFCFPGDVGWASALPFFFYASPALTGLQGFADSAPCVWVLQLRWCLFGVAGAVTLLPFPYLRVGVLLASGVSGVGGLRRRSRLPFVVRPPFLVSVCPSPLLGLGCLVTGLWLLLRLLGFGLF